MSTRKWTVLAGCLVLCGIAWGDQIILKNGDRVTGAIITSDEKEITLKTELMGEVKIQRAGVASIEADKPVTVTLESGEKVVGTVRTEQEQLKVRKSDQTEVAASLASAAIRNDEQQAAWEREQERLTSPRLSDFWSGNIDLALAHASGNARTTTVATGATAQRVTGNDAITLKFAQIFSTQETTLPYGTTANRVSGTARYDHNLTQKLFAYGIAQFDFDEFQNLDLRSVLGAGLGYHVYKSERHYFNVAAGGAWNREDFWRVQDGQVVSEVRNSGEIQLGEESSHQINTSLKVFQSLGVFPNLTNTGEYRLNFDAGASFKVASFLNWNFTFTDRFLSNPIPGNRQNDILLSTGIGITFDQR